MWRNLAVIHSRGARHDDMFLFGHNPNFSIWRTCHLNLIGSFPLVVLLFVLKKSWGLAEAGSGKLEYFDMPKNYR